MRGPIPGSLYAQTRRVTTDVRQMLPSSPQICARGAAHQIPPVHLEFDLADARRRPFAAETPDGSRFEPVPVLKAVTVPVEAAAFGRLCPRVETCGGFSLHCFVHDGCARTLSRAPACRRAAPATARRCIADSQAAPNRDLDEAIPMQPSELREILGPGEPAVLRHPAHQSHERNDPYWPRAALSPQSTWSHRPPVGSPVGSRAG